VVEPAPVVVGGRLVSRDFRARVYRAPNDHPERDDRDLEDEHQVDEGPGQGADRIDA
jgi:hypothetical protein